MNIKRTINYLLLVVIAVIIICNWKEMLVLITSLVIIYSLPGPVREEGAEKIEDDKTQVSTAKETTTLDKDTNSLESQFQKAVAKQQELLTRKEKEAQLKSDFEQERLDRKSTEVLLKSQRKKPELDYELLSEIYITEMTRRAETKYGGLIETINTVTLPIALVNEMNKSYWINDYWEDLEPIHRILIEPLTITKEQWQALCLFDDEDSYPGFHSLTEMIPSSTWHTFADSKWLAYEGELTAYEFLTEEIKSCLEVNK